MYNNHIIIENKLSFHNQLITIQNHLIVLFNVCQWLLEGTKDCNLTTKSVCKMHFFLFGICYTNLNCGQL